MKANVKRARAVLESLGFKNVEPVVNRGGVLLVDAKATSVRRMAQRAQELAAHLRMRVTDVKPTYGGKTVRVYDRKHRREVTFTRYNGCAEMHIEFVDYTIH